MSILLPCTFDDVQYSREESPQPGSPVLALLTLIYLIHCVKSDVGGCLPV